MKSKIVLFVLIILVVACKRNSNLETDSNAEEKQIAQMVQKKYPKTSNYPEADQFDDEMEADFVRAANEYQSEITANKALITSRKWVIYKDYNGSPIKRNRIAVVTAQIGEQCFLQHLFFQQDAKGSKYGKTYVSDSYGWKEFDCSLKN